MKTESRISGAIVGKSGKLYVQTGSCFRLPLHEIKYAVYDSVEAYNSRLHIPDYIYRDYAMDDFLEWVDIDLKTLKTI